MISDVTKYKFKYDKNLIKDYENWSILFRYQQFTIGSLIIISKSGEVNLGALSAKEWADFAEVARDAESLLVNAFGAEKFNYLALMMKDPEVHFHVVPRYSKPVVFQNKEYVDPDWPLATEKVVMELDEQTLGSIKAKIMEFVA